MGPVNISEARNYNPQVPATLAEVRTPKDVNGIKDTRGMF